METKKKKQNFMQLQWLMLLVIMLGRGCLAKITLKLTLLHSEQPKLYRVLAILSAVGLKSLDDINHMYIKLSNFYFFY